MNSKTYFFSTLNHIISSLENQQPHFYNNNEKKDTNEYLNEILLKLHGLKNIKDEKNKLLEEIIIIKDLHNNIKRILGKRLNSYEYLRILENIIILGSLKSDPEIKKFFKSLKTKIPIGTYKKINPLADIENFLKEKYDQLSSK